MTEHPRDQAIIAADAVLNLPSPLCAQEAWRVLSELSRLATVLRSANEEAACGATGDPLAWLAPSSTLATRLQSTAARWTVHLTLTTGWGQEAVEALDRELGAADRLAVELASVAEFCARVEEHGHVGSCWTPDSPELESRRRRATVWASACVLSATVAIGVFGALAFSPDSRVATVESAGTITHISSPISSTPTAARAAAPTAAPVVRQHNRVPPARAAFSADAPAPTETRAVAFAAVMRGRSRHIATHLHARDIGYARAHPSRPRIDPTASALTELENSVAMAVSQEIQALIYATLQTAQQQESAVIANLEEHGSWRGAASRDPR